MIAKRLGILAAAAMLPALAQVANEPANMAARGAPVSVTGWSGYMVTGTAFTAAHGSWIVPTATCTSGRQYAQFFVGMDGFTTPTEEVIGTEADCIGASPSYYAFYEVSPNSTIRIEGMTIAAGDRIVAEVTYSAPEFTFTIKDETSGKAYRTSATVADAQRSSAEWIASIAYDGEILPLTDFGTVLFGEDSTGVTGTNSATDSTNSGPIGAFPAADIEQFTKIGTATSPQTSTCTSLSSDGTSFSCTWSN
jgi:hypothetical protein